MSADLLDELVHQFSDPFAFYRELIQNSLDSGSTRIEVVLQYTPNKKLGLATATVADWGEGMNRKVIDDYLLTKFRSSKENDLTKIGKFGIGFVSVFACAPDAVVVDTGRDGEFWRVLFKKDKSYELLKLDAPVEGTRVTVHKHLRPSAYDDFAKQSEAAVRRWCRHCESDIAFAAGSADGKPAPEPVPVNAPFEVDAPYQVELKEEGTLIVAGVSRERPAPSGLYNRGLTLLETDEPLVPNVAIKIASRWLEHTLTRDNVRRDKNFEKAIDQARRLTKGALKERLPDELRRCAVDPKLRSDWQVLFTYALQTIGLEQAWLRHPGGGASRAKRKKVIFFADETGPLVTRLIAAGVPVVEAAGDEGFIALLKKRAEVLPAAGHWVHAEPLPVVRAPAFCAAMLAGLKAAGAGTRQVALTRLFGATTGPFALVKELGIPEPIEKASGSPFDAFAPPVLAIDLAHEELAAVTALLETAPRLAALLVARRLAVMNAALTPARDWALTQWALR